MLAATIVAIAVAEVWCSLMPWSPIWCRDQPGKLYSVKSVLGSIPSRGDTFIKVNALFMFL